MKSNIMAQNARIGIDNIGYYVPKLRVSIQKLMKSLFNDNPELLERMCNAIKTTGQQFMRITQKWQDSVCLASESVLDLIDNVSADTVRFLVSATETSVDASKPIAAYVLGILKRIGVKLPANLSTYQTQHACAGGTISLLQCLSMILTLKKESSAIVSMTDIARYDKDTTAEITQGAGSVSLFICKNPRLIELDAETVGVYSEDTDDFFRPMSSVPAKVKGKYSMKCYLASVYNALNDYAENKGETIEEVLMGSDYFCFHLPFASMSKIALMHILRRKLKWDSEKIDSFIANKYIQESAEIISSIGNTYTASTYFSLGYLLCKQYQSIQEGIIGKKILILTYGSGNTSMVMSGTIAEKAPEIIKTWSLLKQLEDYQEINERYYREWLASELPIAPTEDEIFSLSPKSIYLKLLREDGYRIYQQVP